MKKKFIALIILLIILGVGIWGYFKILNKDDSSVGGIFNNKKYVEYKVGDTVNFKDGEWYVLYDSPAKDNYVTLISADILYLDEQNITQVMDSIYETSDLNDYLKNEYANSLGRENLVERNGYQVRLFNQDDFSNLIRASYDEENDEYLLEDCPDFICLTNTSYATMIDTNSDIELEDVYYNVSDIEDVMYDDYILHLKYYNISTTYDTYKMTSLVDDATLFVRPVINVYKDSLTD